MEKSEMIDKINAVLHVEYINGDGLLALAKQLIKDIFGMNNPFYQQLDTIAPNWPDTTKYERVKGILNALKNAVNMEILSRVSMERRIQIEVVSEYLNQAQELLGDKSFHPAAAVVLIGASLEEFLRNWCKEEGCEIVKSDGIDSLSKQLKDKGLLGKQDLKDITAWAGIRNDAAHGHWDLVDDRKRIMLMIDGVNHFIRIKTDEKSR